MKAINDDFNTGILQSVDYFTIQALPGKSHTHQQGCRLVTIIMDPDLT